MGRRAALGVCVSRHRLRKGAFAVLVLVLASAAALVACALLRAPAFAVAMDSNGTVYAEDDAAAMSEYDFDIWSDHADTAWYEGREADDSYTLTTAEQLAGLAVLVTKQGVTFEGKAVRLAADVDLDAHQWFPIGCNEANYWGQSPFKGTFDGGGHAISNLRIENGWHGQALFGECQDAWVGNFTLTGSVTTGWQAAGVVAEMGRTTLSNIVNYANVKTLFKSGDGGYASTAGGIVAYVADVYVNRTGTRPSRLESLVNYGTVEIAGITEQGGGVGGIAGSLLVADDDQTIVVSQCENHGSVKADSSNYVDVYVKGAGGIVGSTATYGNYDITDCSNTGDVDSDNLASTGGIAGSISGLSSSVEYCYNAGTVNGSSPEDVAAACGIVGRSVAAHTGNTQLDVVSCYNVGDVIGRGGNVAAILGSTSGYGEDWGSNDGGTTVRNDSNYYLEDSAKPTSQTGVLFQSGTIESGQEVSLDRMNSQEVIDRLNSTDKANDHYTAGDETPRLELTGSSDMGIDQTSSEGAGADQAVLGQAADASQRETHMYAIKADLSANDARAAAFDVSILLLPIGIAVLVLVGIALQALDFRRQTRPLKPIAEPKEG